MWQMTSKSQWLSTTICMIHSGDIQPSIGCGSVPGEFIPGPRLKDHIQCGQCPFYWRRESKRRSLTTQLHLRHLFRPSNVITAHIQLSKAHGHVWQWREYVCASYRELLQPHSEKRVYDILIGEGANRCDQEHNLSHGFFPSRPQDGCCSSTLLIPIQAERNRKAESSMKFPQELQTNFISSSSTRTRSHEYTCLEGS